MSRPGELRPHRGRRELGTYVAAKLEIINVEIPDASGWSEMGEIMPR